eukprot:4235920-Pyramimonas_sp.AAC.1
MAAPLLFRCIFCTFRGPIWNATEGSNGCARMRPRPISAYPLHASWKAIPTTAILTTAYCWALRRDNLVLYLHDRVAVSQE